MFFTYSINICTQININQMILNIKKTFKFYIGISLKMGRFDLERLVIDNHSDTEIFKHISNKISAHFSK